MLHDGIKSPKNYSDTQYFFYLVGLNAKSIRILGGNADADTAWTGKKIGVDCRDNLENRLIKTRSESDYLTFCAWIHGRVVLLDHGVPLL